MGPSAKVTRAHGLQDTPAGRRPAGCQPFQRGPFPARRRVAPPASAIGVPRVPYRLPRSNRWVWIDLWNVLYRQRIMFLTKPVDDELSNQLVATMLYLDTENQKDLNLYINCAGGDVVPCLALHDTMRHIKSDVATAAFGGAMGMSGFLLAVGKRGKRAVLQNTRIMLHAPTGYARGQASDINREAQELLRMRDYVNAVLSYATGKDFETVEKDLVRNKYFEAKEAKEYGLIDVIIKHNQKKVARGA